MYVYSSHVRMLMAINQKERALEERTYSPLLGCIEISILVLIHVKIPIFSVPKMFTTNSAYLK